MTDLLHPARSRRVGLVLLTGIGDVVHGLPLAHDLKRQDPSREVVWIAEPAPAEVVRHHPAVDRVVVFDKKAGWAGARALHRAFRSHPCDLTLNLMRYIKGAVAAVLTGAPVRVGLPPSKTRDGASFFNTMSLSEGPWQHTQDLFLRFREPLGLPSDTPVEWGVTFTEAERREQGAFFEPVRGAAVGPLIGLVLGTANASKDWPADRYPALARALIDRFRATVLLIGGPSARERDAANRIREAGVPVIDTLGDSVRRMMTRVDGVDLLVSPDTGPLHLAHALGTRVVGLFGHTNPWRVGPWRRDHDLVIDRYTDEGESPDPSRYDPRSGRMERITVDDVVEAVARGLKGPR
jgi:heptosyltransferase I